MSVLPAQKCPSKVRWLDSLLNLSPRYEWRLGSEAASARGTVLHPAISYPSADRLASISQSTFSIHVLPLMRDFTARRITCCCWTWLILRRHPGYVTPLSTSLTCCAMDDCSFILLPYGLSNHYKNFWAGGKGIPMPCRPSCFRTATIQELSTLHPFSAPKASPTPTSIARNERRALKERLGTARKQTKMGFQRNLRRINMGPAQGKEKRGRLRKKPHPPAPAPTPAVMKRKS
jgi:hypothetical protein